MDLQVSIPKTSTCDESYTIYHILVKLPLRKYELEKRYSDFTKLVTDMEHNLCNSNSNNKGKFPIKLPPKTNGIRLFGRNKDIDDAELIEYRRTEFEKILKNVVNATNGIGDEWRNSSPFLEFLELPPGIFKEKFGNGGSGNNISNGSFSNANEAKKNSIYSSWSLTSSGSKDPILDVSNWLDTVRDCKKLLQQARSNCFNNQQQTRKNLIIVKSKLDPLTMGLKFHENSSNSNSSEKQPQQWQHQEGGGGVLGSGEIRRRKDLLNSIKQEHAQIEELVASVNNERYSEDNDSYSNTALQMPGGFNSNSRNLFSGISSRRVLGQPLEETNETRGLNDNELLQQQKLHLKDQDEELLYLQKVIRKQKMMGITINEELEYQNSLLDELNQEVDNTSTKLKYANKKAKRINN